MSDHLSPPQSAEVSAPFGGRGVRYGKWGGGWEHSAAPTPSELPKGCGLQEEARDFSHFLFLFPKGSCHVHCPLPHTMAIRFQPSASKKVSLGFWVPVAFSTHRTQGVLEGSQTYPNLQSPFPAPSPEESRTTPCPPTHTHTLGSGNLLLKLFHLLFNFVLM